jgi:hypothetical protein
MAALSLVNMFRGTPSDPSCLQFLELEEQARLGAVCKTAATCLLLQRKVVREWVSFWQKNGKKSKENPLPLEQFCSILRTALHSHFFFSASGTRFLNKICARFNCAWWGGLSARENARKQIAAVLCQAPHKALKYSGIQQILEQFTETFVNDPPIAAVRKFRQIGSDMISPGTPGRKVLERELNRRARKEFLQQMDQHNTYKADRKPRVWCPDSGWFEDFLPCGKEQEKEMPEIVQEALVNAVQGTGPCLFRLEYMQPSYTRSFVAKLAQNPAPIYVTGDGVLPTDARYVHYPFPNKKARRAFAKGNVALPRFICSYMY